MTNFFLIFSLLSFILAARKVIFSHKFIMKGRVYTCLEEQIILPAEAKITINGKDAGNIPNILKGHSDSRYSDNSYMQARIFSLNENGTLAKSFVFSPVDNTGSIHIGNDWNLRITCLVISKQAHLPAILQCFRVLTEEMTAQYRQNSRFRH